MSQLTGNRSATRGGLAVLCVAQFVVVLDVTVVATALPAIGSDLGFAPTGLTWVITAYTVVMAGLLVLGGRVADLAGARRMFATGLAVFAAASVACALAWSPAVLIGGRVVQGVGAALLSPAALAALHALVSEPEARRRALGWWTAAAAGGGACGWVLGGVLVELAGWRWIFAINAPVGLVALVAARRALAHLGGRPALRGLDLPGALLVTGGIALAALGLSRVAEHPARPGGWTAVALAAVLLALFARQERRAPDALVPPRLAGAPGVLGGNLTAAALTAATTPAMLTVVLYVQDTLRLPAARGSLLFPAFNLAVVGGSLLGSRLLVRRGARALLGGGFAAVVAGIALLLTLPDRGVPVGVLLGSFALTGAGLGAASVASTAAGTAAVDERDRGVAAGLLTSTAQLGTALGLAVTTPLVAAAAPMTGYRLGFGVAALIGVAGLLAARTVPRSSRRPSRPVDPVAP
jgi:MFS family permease